MTKLLINIKELVQIRDNKTSYLSSSMMTSLPSIKNAFLLIKNGVISDFGPMSDIPSIDNSKVIDTRGKFVIPSWCDSHSHSVFFGTRSDEYFERLKGVEYNDIAKKGGGILKSCKQVNNASENELFEVSLLRVKKLIRNGTGSLEIKSGYGLNYDSELKILRVIQRIKDSLPIMIKSTFLGAHAVPKNISKKEYLNNILYKMLPDFTKMNLIDFVDVFCEKNYFSVKESSKIFSEAKKYNIRPKIHANQFNSIGGVQVAIENHAISIDHLEKLNEQDIKYLKKGGTMPVILPGCSFFLDIDYCPVDKLIKNDIPFAIASDYNPGSCPTGNMNFIVALACKKLKLSIEQAINAATLNGAYAMGVSNILGSITKGKRANLIITEKIDSLRDLPYFISENLINQVLINGNEVI